MNQKRKRVINRDKNNQEGKSTVSFEFERAYDYFYSSKKAEGLRKPTLVSYREHYCFFIKWRDQHYPELRTVADLSPMIIREYVNYLRHDHYNYKTKEYGLSIQTCNARLRFLKTFYSFLIKEEIESSNPAGKVSYIKEDERKFVPLTEVEMDKILAVPDVTQYPQFRDKVLMYLLYDTSLRIKEAVSLKLENVDLANKRILLHANQAKGRKARIVPLSSYTIKLLIELITENETHFNSPFIFLNWYGEQMAEDTFRRNLGRYVKKAGINRKFTPHDMRRQSITEMLVNGASLFTVMSIAGHSQISTTKKYVHFDEQTIKNQHDLYSPVVKKRKKK